MSRWRGWAVLKRLGWSDVENSGLRTAEP